MQDSTEVYLDVSPLAGATFMRRGLVGPVVILNLLRFRAVADYAAHSELAPAAPIRGSKAFARYAAHTRPFLTRSGGEIVGYFEAGTWLIGPEGKRWERAMLIRRPAAPCFWPLPPTRPIWPASAIARPRW